MLAQDQPLQCKSQLQVDSGRHPSALAFRRNMHNLRPQCHSSALDRLLAYMELVMMESATTLEVTVIAGKAPYSAQEWRD